MYDKLIPDIPKSTRPVVEFLLEYYPVSKAVIIVLSLNKLDPQSKPQTSCIILTQVMIYDGAKDIVCHPVGNFNMLDATESWSGKEVPSFKMSCRKRFLAI